MVPEKITKQPASSDAGQEVLIEPGLSGGGFRPGQVDRQYEDRLNGRILSVLLRRCALAQI
jgi:hypothetical protein